MMSEPQGPSLGESRLVQESDLDVEDVPRAPAQAPSPAILQVLGTPPSLLDVGEFVVEVTEGMNVCSLLVFPLLVCCCMTLNPTKGVFALCVSSMHLSTFLDYVVVVFFFVGFCPPSTHTRARARTRIERHD